MDATSCTLEKDPILGPLSNARSNNTRCGAVYRYPLGGKEIAAAPRSKWWAHKDSNLGPAD